MRQRAFKRDSYASGDLGPVLVVLMFAVGLLLIEFAFGYDDITSRFEEPYDDELSFGETTDGEWFDPIIDFFEGIGEAVTGVWDALSVFFDLMFINVGEFADMPVILRIVFALPIWFCFGYLFVKVIRGF